MKKVFLETNESSSKNVYKNVFQDFIGLNILEENFASDETHADIYQLTHRNEVLFQFKLI